MQKGNARTLGAGYRRLVDQTKSLSLEILEMLLEIRHPKADVMDSFTAFLDEFRHGRIWRQRLEQLEIRITNRNERRLDALRLHAFHTIDGEAEGGVNAGGIEGFHRDPNMIQNRFHTPRASAPQMCLCNCVCSRAGRRSSSIHCASDFKSISPQTGDRSTVQRCRFRSLMTCRAQS